MNDQVVNQRYRIENVESPLKNYLNPYCSDWFKITDLINVTSKINNRKKGPDVLTQWFTKNMYRSAIHTIGV